MRPLTLLLALASLACGGRADLIGPAGTFDAGLTHDGATAMASAAADAGAGHKMDGVMDEPARVPASPRTVRNSAGAPDAGCHGTVIRASDYDQVCTTDADCVAVEEGDTCADECQSCNPHAAINQRSLERYRADIAEAIATGHPIHWIQCPCPPRIPQPCCHGGQCAAGVGCDQSRIE
jgi:hypothetical protein